MGDKNSFCFILLLLLVVILPQAFGVPTHEKIIGCGSIHFHANSSFNKIFTLRHQDPPEVTITVDDKLPCVGQSITFMAAVTNGGTTPSYQWQINGVNVGKNSPAFTVDGLNTKLSGTDVVRCIVTNDDNGSTAISNIISSIAVLDISTTQVKMYYNQNQIKTEVSVCQAMPIAFTLGISISNNALFDPSFKYIWQYQINGADLPVGADLSSFIKNGDTVTIKVTFTSKCFNRILISTNKTIVNVTPSTPAFVSIAVDSTGSCVGSPVTFKALALNAGTSPFYQWLLNGQKVGKNDSTYSSSALKTGDQLQCEVTSSDVCAIDMAMSNTLTIDLIPIIHNFVTISSLATGSYIVSGQSVTFTAKVSDSTKVSYQWQVNGKSAGTNNSIFNSSAFKLGDVVTCKVTKAGKCVVPQVATSNAITVLILTPIIIPNTFTPNGDGINDTWALPSLIAYPSSVVQVFNRYGALIYQSIGYTSAWNGTKDGKAIPVGTYYYIIDLKNKRQILSGSLTLLR